MRSFKIGVVKFLTVLFAMLMLGTSTFAQVSVTLPTVSGVSGSAKAGAITVGDLTGLNVRSFQFTINYDKDILYITGADVAGTLIESSAGNLEVNPDTANGKISVAWASATALSGSGTLVKLNFLFRNSGTAALSFGSTFMFNAGTPAATITDGNATSPSVLVTGGTVSYNTGDDVKIPIFVTAITSAQNVRSFDFTATFTSTIFSITGYDKAGTLSADGNAEINVVNGTVSLAWASASSITGDGVLIYLVGKALSAGTSALAFTSFKFNAGAPIAGTENGSVVVGAANVAPTVAFNPAGPAFSTNENQALTFTVVGADANGDALTYTATGMPSGATLNATTHVFSWTPNYTQSGSHTVTFKVTDAGGLFAEKTATITVVNVNRAPSIIVGLPVTLDVPVHIAPNPVYWTKPIVASDPDGDALSYSLEASPEGSNITSDGVFSWAPLPSQAGKSFVITIKVSDGSLSDSKSYTLKVSDTIIGVEIEGVPTEYTLMQNYPNPFNPSTTIYFGIPKESNVKISVFNILGQEVTLLLDKTLNAGFHKVTFNAEGLNTGMYIYKIEAGSFVEVKKMLYVK